MNDKIIYDTFKLDLRFVRENEASKLVAKWSGSHDITLPWSNKVFFSAPVNFCEKRLELILIKIEEKLVSTLKNAKDENELER